MGLRWRLDWSSVEFAELRYNQHVARYARVSTRTDLDRSRRRRRRRGRLVTLGYRRRRSPRESGDERRDTYQYDGGLFPVSLPVRGVQSRRTRSRDWRGCWRVDGHGGRAGALGGPCFSIVDHCGAFSNVNECSLGCTDHDGRWPRLPRLASGCAGWGG